MAGVIRNIRAVNFLRSIIMGPYKNHIQLSGELFEAVQKKDLFLNGKKFVDMTPKKDPETILRLWKKLKDEPGFDLKQFVLNYFNVPEEFHQVMKIERKKECREHVKALWPGLFRRADKAISDLDSLLPLPHPYVVREIRFREIYYWDSYFTAQGLRADGHESMILNMAENFKYLVETYGYVPNGNRVYYLSRSQPPFFAPLAEMVIHLYGDEKIGTFLPAVEKEYDFWMKTERKTEHRAVEIVTEETDEEDEKTVKTTHRMNRYWDEYPKPRVESWNADMKAAKNLISKERTRLFRDIRAACESGWDFSSRWFGDGENLSTIDTTNILPVDLNTLIWYMERKISKWNAKLGNDQKAREFELKAYQRKKSINKLMWSKSEGFFFDYHIVNHKKTPAWSLASVYPLYFELATKEQAIQIADHLEHKFLKRGGLVTTLHKSGHQWDAPNGWAHLHWLAVVGLKRYGFNDLSDEISRRWRSCNENVFQRTGKMAEKYNVIDLNRYADDNDLLMQDGFGSTNGVYSALVDMAD